MDLTFDVKLKIGNSKSWSSDLAGAFGWDLEHQASQSSKTHFDTIALPTKNYIRNSKKNWKKKTEYSFPFVYIFQQGESLFFLKGSSKRLRSLWPPTSAEVSVEPARSSERRMVRLWVTLPRRWRRCARFQTVLICFNLDGLNVHSC